MASVNGIRVKHWDLLLLRRQGKRAGSCDASVVVAEANCARRAKKTAGAVVRPSGSRADPAQIVKERGVETSLMRRVVLGMVGHKS